METLHLFPGPGPWPRPAGPICWGWHRCWPPHMCGRLPQDSLVPSCCTALGPQMAGQSAGDGCWPPGLLKVTEGGRVNLEVVSRGTSCLLGYNPGGTLQCGRLTPKAVVEAAWVPPGAGILTSPICPLWLPLPRGRVPLVPLGHCW